MYVHCTSYYPFFLPSYIAQQNFRMESLQSPRPSEPKKVARWVIAPYRPPRPHIWAPLRFWQIYFQSGEGGHHSTAALLQIFGPSYSPGLSIVLEALFSFFCVSKCFTQQMEHQIPKMKKLRNLIIVLCILLQRGKRDSGNDLSVHTAWTWI